MTQACSANNITMKQPSWREVYPFASHWIEVDQGLRQHYIDEGPRDAEQTIVAVHGNPTWSFFYRSMIDAFRKSVRVIAIDHLGCGLSDKPQAYDYCLSNHTANLLNLIDTIHVRNATLVVHDWGGAIGLGAAVQRQDIFERFLVLNTGAFPPPYLPRRIAACRWPWIGSFAVRYWNAFAQTATFMAIDRLPRLNPVAKAGLLAPYDTPANRIAIDRFVQDIPMTRSHKTFGVLEALEKRLPELSGKRIHFVWGMKDWCFRPECMERLSISWPDATRCELADVGHYVMEEAPEEVVRELAWLLNLPATNVSG